LVPAQKAPTGILPPALARTGADSDVAELLTAAFVVRYPDIRDIGELEKGERAAWIRLRESLLKGDKAAIEALRGLVQMLDKQVEAEVEDLSERRVEVLKDKAARRKRKNQHHAQALKIRFEEHEQTIKEREIRLANQSLKERLLIAMTGISFICLVICFVIASLTGQVIAYGGGIVFSSVSIIGMIRLFILGRDEDSESEKDDPGGD
jgi:hypothetical protein